MTSWYRYSERGFTLIEMLVVVALLGVLASIAIPNVISLRDKGRSEAAQTELHNVQTAVLLAMHKLNSPGVSAPSNLDASTDIDIDGDGTAADAGPLIIGGITSLHGTYTVDAIGSVTQSSYP